MKINSKEALALLEEYRGIIDNSYRINHSICVGNCAGVIAEKLNLDKDKAKTLGYLHDIGKVVDITKNHTIYGYELLKNLGYDDDYCNICLTHSYLNNDFMCTAGGIPKNITSRTDFISNHEYTIYEKIINISDLMCTDKIVGLDKRLIEIMRRLGVHDNTVYHINESYKLKEYFDKLLGYNLYELFSEIKINL